MVAALKESYEVTLSSQDWRDIEYLAKGLVRIVELHKAGKISPKQARTVLKERTWHLATIARLRKEVSSL
jgi:hypothetical protein